MSDSATPRTAACQASLSFTVWVCSKSHPSSQWLYPTSSASVTPFSSCPQSFPASRSFPTIQLFSSGGQSMGVSALASVLPVNIQGWFPLGLTCDRGRLNTDLDTTLHVLLRIVSVSNDRNPAPLSSFERLGTWRREKAGDALSL